MSFTVSLSSAVLLCDIVEPATLNDRSLAALKACRDRKYCIGNYRQACK